MSASLNASGFALEAIPPTVAAIAQAPSIAQAPAIDWRHGGASLSSRVVDCASGDRKALEILYNALAGGIRRRLVHMLSDVTLAEDVVQETFVSVWRYAHRFDPKIGLPVTWIWAIARNRALTALAFKRRECSLDGVSGLNDWPDLGPTPYDQILRGEEAIFLQRCIAKLAPIEQRCIELAYFQGLSYSEVSLRLGRPLGSVKTTFRHAFQRLRACMKREMSSFP